MFSFITNIANGIMQSRALKAQSRSYSTQASLYEIQAKAQRNQANAQADNIEEANRRNMDIAGMNIRTLRDNQRAVAATKRVQQAGSGLTTEGTGKTAENQAINYYEEVIANASLSASIANTNAWQNSISTRRQGEMQAAQSELQAMQYRYASQAAAKQSKNAMTGTIVNTGLGAAGLYALDDGEANGLNSYQQALYSDYVANSVFSLAGGMNVWTAGMTRGQNYGGAYSLLMGNVPMVANNQYKNNGLLSAGVRPM